MLAQDGILAVTEGYDPGAVADALLGLDEGVLRKLGDAARSTAMYGKGARSFVRLVGQDGLAGYSDAKRRDETTGKSIRNGLGWAKDQARGWRDEHSTADLVKLGAAGAGTAALGAAGLYGAYRGAKAIKSRFSTKPAPPPANPPTLAQRAYGSVRRTGKRIVDSMPTARPWH